MFSLNSTPHIVAMLKIMNISMPYWSLNQIEYKRKNINLLLTKAILRIGFFEILKLLLILAAGGLGGGLYKGLQWEEQRRKFRPGSRTNGKYVRHVLPHKIAAQIGVAANVTFFTQTMSVSQSSLNNIESISHQSIIWKSVYNILRNSSYTQQYIQFTTCGRPNDKHNDAKNRSLVDSMKNHHTV